MREQEHHENIGNRSQTQRKREALDVTDSHEIEDNGRENVDSLGSQNRTTCTVPARLNGLLQPTTLAQLITNTFEVDDERVGRQTNRDNQTRDTRQRQAIISAPPQQNDRKVGQRAHDDERGHRDQTQNAVLEERIDSNQHQTDQARDHA